MTITNGVDADRLRAFIGRIERLEEEKAGIAADIKDVYAEAKGTGYDVKTIRQIIKLRKIEADDRREQEELLDLYKHALGMLADLPLGEAAIEREVSPVRRAVRKMQAARPATPHDPATGEITDPAEVRALDGIANAETSAVEAAHEAAGAPLHSSEEPAPQPLYMPSAEFDAVIVSAAPDDVVRIRDAAQVSTARQPLRTLPPRIPEPAPDWPEMPAGLDRSKWAEGGAA